jgi:hypothetical protein
MRSGSQRPEPKRLKPSKALTDLRAYRQSREQNQSDFWRPLGLTQSAGSRYEIGRALPTPTALLVVLRELGKVSDRDLAEALAIVAMSR